MKKHLFLQSEIDHTCVCNGDDDDDDDIYQGSFESFESYLKAIAGL